MVTKINLHGLIFALLLIPVNAVAAPCTEDDAMNKMMALNRAASRMMASGPQTATSPAVKLSTESGPGSQMIADKKFDQACMLYDELAKKYNIDLKKESEGLITMEELRKDGGKRGGECSVADASKKMMGLHQQIEDKVALGEMSRDAFSQFGKDTSKFGELMVTDPSEVCRQLDGLKEKYKLN